MMRETGWYLRALPREAERRIWGLSTSGKICSVAKFLLANFTFFQPNSAELDENCLETGCCNQLELAA